MLHALRALVLRHRPKFCLSNFDRISACKLNSPLPDTSEQPKAKQHSQEKKLKGIERSLPPTFNGLCTPFGQWSLHPLRLSRYRARATPVIGGQKR